MIRLTEKWLRETVRDRFQSPLIKALARRVLRLERLAQRNRDMANILAGENLVLHERVKQLGVLTKEDIEHAFGEERKPHA